MRQSLEILTRAARVALGLTLAVPAVDPAAATDDSVSIDDIRFASQIGMPVLSSANPLPISSPLSAAEFRGTSGQSCASLDLNTFLHRFDPHELLAELRQSLLSGAQSEISNYLVALAYSAPTLASVLEMTDRQVAARFNAFAQTCASQQVRASGLQDAERRLARASDQCFAREIARGTAPTDAYRHCSVARNFDNLTIPAALSTIDFLRRHSDLEVTPRIEFLLALLPDERIVGGNYQIRPPRTTLASFSDALQARSRLALDQMIDGAAPATIAECALDSILDPSGSACLPRSATTVVASPAFRGARLLGPEARSMFKEALSSQIAVTAVYSDLLDLTQQVSRMNLRTDSDASASEIQSRQRALQDQMMHLLGQADLQLKLQESKLKLARTQLLALERAQVDLRVAADELQAKQNGPAFSVSNVLRLFQDRN
jgi:hypothetical protein